MAASQLDGLTLKFDSCLVSKKLKNLLGSIDSRAKSIEPGRNGTTDQRKEVRAAAELDRADNNVEHEWQQSL
jgi:hypothetical protein